MYSTIVDTKNKVSQIPEGGLEISKLNSTPPCKIILEKNGRICRKTSCQDFKNPSNLMKMLVAAAMKGK